MKEQSSNSGCTLDHLDHIYLSKEEQERYTNELESIRYLKDGLVILATWVNRIEIKLRKIIPSEHEATALTFGTAPELQGIPYGFIASAFHWYSVSACNMVKLIGSIAKQQDSSRVTPAQYTESVLPRIKSFRDKIGAHFSASMTSTHDNPAERTLSVLPPVVYTNNHFVASLFVLVQAEAETLESSNSSGVQPWSLTVAHEELGRRYWNPGAPHVGAT